MRHLRNDIRVTLPGWVLALLFCAPLCAQEEFELRVGMAGAGRNTWPEAESPDHAIDGVGQKYLNFGRENTGFIVSPSIGSSTADSLTLWTANDAEPRDPASFRLFGTDSPIDPFAPPGTAFPLADFTEIAFGDLSLPSTRNPGGAAELMEANSLTVDFDNTTAYESYLVLFPTVKNPASANSMQIAEVQLTSAGSAIFTPGDPILGVQLFAPIGDPVGPQPEPTAGNWSVREWRPYTAVNGTEGADMVINDPQWQFDLFVSDGMRSMINLADPQAAGGGYSIVLPKQPIVSDTPAADDDIVMRAISRVIIPEDGDYTFGIDGDDGTRLTVQGADFTYQGGNMGGMASGEVLEFPMNTGNAHTLASTFLTAGEHEVELVWQERGGGAFVEVFAASGVHNAADVLTARDKIEAGFAPIGLTEEVVVAQGMLPTTVGEWEVRNVDVVSTIPSTATDAMGNPLTGLNNLADAQAAIDLLEDDPNFYIEFSDESTADVINFNDPDASPNTNTGGGRFLPDTAFPIDAFGTDDNDFALEATVTVSIPEENDYIFGFGSDDGAALTLTGADFTILGTTNADVAEVTNDGQTIEFNANTGNSDTFATTHLMPGEYELTYLMWERGGGAWAEVYTAIGDGQDDLLSFRATLSLLGSPADTFDLVYSPGLQLAGEGGGEILEGDYSGNGLVEQADLDLVLGNWGVEAANVPAAWMNDLPMGFVDQNELDKVLSNWGASAGLGNAAGVPEPSSIALLLVVAGLGLGARLARKR